MTLITRRISPVQARPTRNQERRGSAACRFSALKTLHWSVEKVNLNPQPREDPFACCWSFIGMKISTGNSLLDILCGCDKDDPRRWTKVFSDCFNRVPPRPHATDLRRER